MCVLCEKHVEAISEIRMNRFSKIVTRDGSLAKEKSKLTNLDQEIYQNTLYCQTTIAIRVRKVMYMYAAYFTINGSVIQVAVY